MSEGAPPRRLVRGMPRGIGQWLEAAAVWLAFALLRVLPLDWASAAGGGIARWIGPRLPVSRRARRSLAWAFPEKGPAEIERIVGGMWDHLGRVLAEYPHLGEFRVYEPGGRAEVRGAEHVDRLREDGKPGIFFSAHVGNWELAPVAMLQRGVPVMLIYRAPNNPLVDRLIRRSRRPTSEGLIRKGPEGARAALETLRAGGHIGMLVDQKMNDGIAVPFFGRVAMTAPALARFAYRYDCPIVPVRVERLEGSHFRITFDPPLVRPETGDRQRDVLEFMTRVNAQIESWIRARPEQWLWLHRRWPD
jgi:Kdo2-lipid IVA lauroyltransferase/acyltransferase